MILTIILTAQLIIMSKSVLVTGASGQLGQSFALISPAYKSIDFNFVTRKDLDLNSSENINAYLNSADCNIIINCAAYTGVDKAESEVDVANQINHLAVKQLAEICKVRNIHLIHFSTDYVFNGNNNKPYIENDKVDPINIYGKTKLKGEEALIEINPKGLIIRTSWVYSEFGNNFVKSILRLGAERDKLNIVSDQIGSPTYAVDLARVVLFIIQHQYFEDMYVEANTYHYSDEGVASWYDFTKEILDIKNIECSVNPIETKDYPTAALRPYYSLFNKSKIKETFGVEIPYWKDTLKVCLSKI